MESPPAKAPRHLTRNLVLTAAIMLVALALLYTLGGFVLLPWYLKRELPRIVETQLERHGEVGEITFNPFTLTLEISDFALKEKDGRPLASLKHGVVDLEWRSLPLRAAVFGEIRLDAPVAHIVISPEGRLNFAELGAKQPVTTTPTEARPEATPRIAIGDLQIDHGEIAIDDQQNGYKNRFEDLAFQLSKLSTFENDKGPYTLSARTPGGGGLKWKGDLSVSPLLATGTIALEHSALPELQPFVKEFLNAAITDGRASVELPYRFALADAKPKFEITGGKLAVESLALTANGADAPFFKLAAFALEDLGLDFSTRKVSIGSVRVETPEIKARRNENGEIDLTKLLLPRKPEPPSAPWQVAVTKIELTAGTVALDDRVSGLSPALKDIALKLGTLSADFAQPLAFDVSAGIVSGGSISAVGKLAPGGAIDAQIKGAAIALAPLQSLITRYTNATLASGEIAFAGNLKTGQKNGAISYNGGAGILNLQLNDPTGVPLVGWKSLATTTLQAQTAPLQVQIDALHWDAPAVKFAIAKDKTTNLRRALKRNDNAPATATPPAADATTASANAGAADAGDTKAATLTATPVADNSDSPITMAIRRININQGTLDFSDDSLAGGFATSIHELNGTLNGISSDHSTRSQLALEGRVDDYGLARVSGSLNPFIPRDRSNLRLDFRNLDVTRVTPYLVEFAGYKIASGRLSLDLNYRVQNNLLEGDNKIVLDQFVLGEKVESPGAMDLPLGLAIALLKDSDGKIDLAVPVSGNLDDPKFDYGLVVRKAIFNLITGIITAPFRLIGRLFSGNHGEEAGQIAFDPGSSRLLPPEREKISRIVEMLAKRPELKLAVPARYDSELDARALKRAALRLELGKRAGLDIEVEDPPGPLNMEDKRTRSAVRDLFAERFSNAELDKLRGEAEAKDKARATDSGKPQQSLSIMEKLGRFTSGEPHVADTGEFYRALGSRLVTSQQLPADALTELARKRAVAIADAMKTGGVDAARIALTTANPVSKSDAKSVALDLALSAK